MEELKNPSRYSQCGGLEAFMASLTATHPLNGDDLELRVIGILMEFLPGQKLLNHIAIKVGFEDLKSKGLSNEEIEDIVKKGYLESIGEKDFVISASVDWNSFTMKRMAQSNSISIKGYLGQFLSSARRVPDTEKVKKQTNE